MPRPTDGELKRIRELAAEKRSASAIGRELGRSRNSIVGICHRNGIILQCSKRDGGRKALKKTSAKAKGGKPNGFRYTEDITPEELEAKRAAAREANARKSATVESMLKEAAKGALNRPLVTVELVEPNGDEGRRRKPPKHFKVEGLGQSRCHFPLTDEPPHAFCAKPAVPGSSYCAGHDAICCPGRTK